MSSKRSSGWAERLACQVYGVAVRLSLSFSCLRFAHTYTHARTQCTPAGNVQDYEHDGSAEWNAYWDPEAVATVFAMLGADASSASAADQPKLTVFSLDATNMVPVTKQFLLDIAKQRSWVFSDIVGIAYALTVGKEWAYHHTYFMWDALATGYLGAPEQTIAFDVVRCHVETEGASAGRTVWHRPHGTSSAEHSAGGIAQIPDTGLDGFEVDHISSASSGTLQGRARDARRDLVRLQNSRGIHVSASAADPLHRLHLQEHEHAHPQQQGDEQCRPRSHPRSNNNKRYRTPQPQPVPQQAASGSGAESGPSTSAGRDRAASAIISSKSPSSATPACPADPAADSLQQCDADPGIEVLLCGLGLPDQFMDTNCALC